MPYRFVYKIDGTNHLFQCNINTVQCSATKITGNRARCRRVCAIGSPYCYTHLLSEKKLRIKQSGNLAAGKGLFAQTKDNDNTVVFRKGDAIVHYSGDTIDVQTLNSRYDLDEDHQFTAPYAFELRRDSSYVDAACNRGVGSLVNHKPASTANAKFVKTKDAQGSVNGIKLVANTNIKNNREIFASYGQSYRMRNRTTHRTTYRRR